MTGNFLNSLNSGLEKILESGSLDEAKFTRNGLAKHYAKHVDHEDAPDDEKFENMEPYQYEKRAEELSNAKAGKSDSDDDIVGFIAKDGRINKYRKSTQELVAYSPDGTIISFYKADKDSYNRKVKNRFKEELPENKDE